MKWNLATKSPEKSGAYIVILRDKTGYRDGARYFLYSRKNDMWNSTDDDNGENRIPDIREAETLDTFAGYVYAWAEINISHEELDALEKGVA